MATIVRREIRKRGFFGWLFLLLFIVFNLLMAIWMLSFWADVGERVAQATSEAARGVGRLGAAAGTSFIAFLWVAGAVVLGLFALLTRGRVTVVEERRDERASR
jgi:hypothetical protein